MKVKDIQMFVPYRGYSQADINAQIKSMPKDAEVVGITTIVETGEDGKTIVAGYDVWVALKNTNKKIKDEEVGDWKGII